MLIPINDQFALATDQYSWMIQRRRQRKDRKTGEPVTAWESIAWYASAEQAVNGLRDRMVRASEAETIAEAMRDIESVVAALSHALAPYFEVNRRGDAS